MSQPIITLISLASLLFLFVLVFWAYRDYCVDAFRQRLFTLRDSMFDDATEGKVDFSHPAYGMLRSTMNGYIRYGHRLNLPLVILFGRGRLAEDLGVVPFHKRLEEHASNLDQEQQRLIFSYFNRMNYLLVRHLILSSPVMLVTVIFPLVLFLAANRLVDALVKEFRQPIDRLDSLALTEGEITA